MRVLYLPSGQNDINEAVRYIAIELSNPSAAESLLNELEKKVGLLQSGYWKGQSLKTHSSGLFEDIDLNWCSIKNYYLFFKYEIENDCIRIYHFSHKLRGLHNILKDSF
ncbi:MAG: type II toxin-antitoxin system RelE/ParE family toxin [Clostridiales bacterium]|jgi:plasmid stabilization system protein ParE|nr:type II toxin-antitoxin system RelE/ParE family toxin [Clostridiales bacterium]